MFSPDDTIVAIATPPGRGGIGIVRISGPQAMNVAGAILLRRAPLEPRRATMTRVRGIGNSVEQIADEVVATAFPQPHSYTGQDVVEVSAHGSPVVMDAIVRSAIEAGARLARPGEFTLRAFLNGKRDLIQAEAVADLIEAATPLQARVAFDQLEGTLTRRIAAIDATLFDLIARLEASLDFPDEGYHFIERVELVGRLTDLVTQLDVLLGDAARGRMIREGATVVLAGRPNVGKSSLFNVLAGTERAIVTPIPGTTRDLITERIDLEGLSITLVDTAGWRDTVDIVEREGVSRASQARDVADVVIVVLDRADAATPEDGHLLEATRQLRRIIVANKCDRPRLLEWRDLSELEPLEVSAASGEGVPALRRAIVAALTGGECVRDSATVSNVRHVALLEDARDSIARARDAAANDNVPEEFLLADLQSARTRFDEVVGSRTTDDLLAHIFERFCIGK